MIVGNTKLFSLESNISQAYTNDSLMGLGYFVIYIKNIRYGVYSEDATALGCSFGGVEKRISMRGKHMAPFSNEKNAEIIAKSMKQAIYADSPENTTFFGLPLNDFTDILYSNNIIWAPDGDEAFDDGSYVLHFDIDNKVRVIGFKCKDGNIESLRDILIEANEFYNILNEWHSLFLIDWKTKVAKLIP